MKITAIETIPVSVPLDPARMITSARGAHDRSPYLLLRVRTDEGLVGLGLRTSKLGAYATPLAKPYLGDFARFAPPG